MDMLGFALCPIMRSRIDAFLESVEWWERPNDSNMVPRCRL